MSRYCETSKPFSVPRERSRTIILYRTYIYIHTKRGQREQTPTGGGGGYVFLYVDSTTLQARPNPAREGAS